MTGVQTCALPISVDEDTKILHARIPNAKEHLRPGNRDEFHPKAVLPRLLLGGFLKSSASLFFARWVGDSKLT